MTLSKSGSCLTAPREPTPLNDELHTGPNLISALCDVVLRWRRYLCGHRETVRFWYNCQICWRVNDRIQVSTKHHYIQYFERALLRYQNAAPTRRGRIGPFTKGRKGITMGRLYRRCANQCPLSPLNFSLIFF